jgi:cytolysin-activating lysine-acyltransferase
MMGELTYLLSHSPNHLGYTISDMMRFFMTPIRLNQFRIYRTKDRPVGFVAWASLRPDISARYATGEYELQIKDWRSGRDLWFVEFIAPFGHANRIVRELRQDIFAKSTGRFLRRSSGGVKVVEIFGFEAPRSLPRTSPQPNE